MRRKAPSPDRLMSEHLKAGGYVVITWLSEDPKSCRGFEVVPEVLKSGVIVPIYKGGRKDLLKVDSYRGITLTSMVSKVLDFLLLERLELVFTKVDLPHVNQSPYRKAVSSADAILLQKSFFAKYYRGGSCVYMCLYDLEKAFNSVEYPVLLEKILDVGVNGKMWRLLKSWYDGTKRGWMGSSLRTFRWREV